MKTKSGATGTFCVSFGTTLTGNEWTVASEGVKKEVKDERTGLPPEVRKWGEALAARTQIPEEALADLELVERMLRSGENDGAPLDCTLQI
ncbi:MAG: hypothetical protein FRX48_07556 [Lasallia pustulata]|uniref:Uncharacterized protein n=1 Tax=Lasallia pustulata TaxID=136370 RepID=A0A5M8PI52_9LECA|nr:MAG: hypothetical protein FRX48_07556 [Lasallia pustulata]